MTGIKNSLEKELREIGEKTEEVRKKLGREYQVRMS